MRNPFRIRASQRTINDEQFVKLFGARVLDLASDVADPWGGVVFLRSAPGGGKTTLLRLLTPRPLRLVAKLADDERVKGTYDALNKLGAVNANGAELLGVILSFTPEYRDLAEIDRSNSMFRALLNSRIVIATLRAMLERLEKSYPDDLHLLEASWEPDSSSTIPAQANGKELFEWASNIEREFYSQIDDLGASEKKMEKHPRLDGLKWFARAVLKDPSGPLDLRRVLLLDDLQWLSELQRTGLIDVITNARESCGIWVAERLEALHQHDLLAEGVLQERDYEGVLYLERRWAKAGRHKSYSQFVEQIANLRVAKADGVDSPEFYSLIADDDDPITSREKYRVACNDIEARILDRIKANNRYGLWLKNARQFNGRDVDRAITWRITEILIERNIRKTQSAFDFIDLSTEDFETKEKSVEKAAEHFVRKEIGAPLYFGRETLSVVSSWNVEQYLDVAGDLFDEISAKAAGRRDPPASLSAVRQDAIIRNVADIRWEGLVRRVPMGYDARRFLEAAGSFCSSQTFRPTAPYAPGVTGFAISLDDRKRLLEGAESKLPQYEKFRSVLTSLVSQNLLLPREDHRNKGKSYLLFYLNRLLCVKFDLPLGYGGWREKSLKELINWMENGPEKTLDL